MTLTYIQSYTYEYWNIRYGYYIIGTCRYMDALQAQKTPTHRQAVSCYEVNSVRFCSDDVGQGSDAASSTDRITQQQLYQSPSISRTKRCVFNSH